MLSNKFFPYSSMQEINLDWILTKIKNILRFVPDDGAVGQILRRTAHGAAWSDEQGAGGSVTSVNGQTGTVVLTASDVGALPDTYTAPVDSVNGQTGAVVLSIPTDTGDLTNGAGFVNAAGAAAAAPVQSVNSQTGAVVLGKSDVGLGSVDNVQQYSASNPPPYPVTSVNGQTGDVSLTIPTFHTRRYQFTNLAQYTDYTYYISMPNALDTAQIPVNATVFGMLVDGWSDLGQTFNVCRNGSRGIYVIHQPNFTITSSAYITVYFYYYT